MKNASYFTSKLRRGEVCLGSGISFADPTVTEALSGLLDFAWIDMEHNAYSLETVQAHIIATKGTETTALVRVPENNAATIKTVLDIGADGVIVPMVRTADDVRRAVAACRYPPEGMRGFGPRRPIDHGLSADEGYSQRANEAIIAIAQIEQIEAVNNLDEILAVPGLNAVVIGGNDLSGSMGLMGQPHHPDVAAAIETVIAKSRQAGVFVGIGLADEPEKMAEWLDKGMQWLQVGVDWWLLMRSAQTIIGDLRARIAAREAANQTKE